MTPDECAGPIGVFDSGVGGLTVAAELLRRFPNERILYVADQAHVPYGGRDLAEIRDFATAISDFLALQGCRAIVMACNISSATALSSVVERLPVPVLGMISGAAETVGNWSERPRIGVLATEGTVRSGAYSAQIVAVNPDAFVMEVPCPRFVPLVEMGETETPGADQACLEYLRPLALERCEAIVLGCTHYPYLLPALRRAAEALFPGDVEFVDPAVYAVDALTRCVADLGWWNSSAMRLLLTTGDADTFGMQAPVFLPGVQCEFGQARWNDGRLTLDARIAASA